VEHPKSQLPALHYFKVGISLHRRVGKPLLTIPLLINIIVLEKREGASHEKM
jgi:hypothetical protein